MPKEPKRSGAFYLRHAVTHPMHVLLVLSFPFALFFVWSLSAFVALGIGETALVFVISRTGVFRRWVDDRVRAEEAAAAAKTRAQLLARITDAHRAEFLRLEILCDAIHERLTTGQRAPLGAEGDYLGTGRLLATYVGGAIAFRTANACLVATDRKAIESEIASLTQMASAGRTEAMRTVAAQRVRIARMRAERWDATYDELAVMHEQLSLIGDLVRLMYEHASAPVQSQALREEVDRGLASVKDGERTVRELVELLAVNDAPEPKVLETGRRALAAMAEQAARITTQAPPATQNRLRVDSTADGSERTETSRDWLEEPAHPMLIVT